MNNSVAKFIESLSRTKSPNTIKKYIETIEKLNRCLIETEGELERLKHRETIFGND